MIEDKLTHDERLRLECLAQAIAFKGASDLLVPTERVLVAAKNFEEYVSGKNNDKDNV